MTRALLVSLFPLLLLVPSVAGAQQPADIQRHGSFATRAELERLASSAESTAVLEGGGEEADALRFEAALLRARLRDGDFQPGDQLVLVQLNDPPRLDTLIVRDGRTIAMFDLPELSLAGVLRSEVDAHVTAHVARFIKDPRLRVTPLIRVAILGHVNRPGFYALPADALIGDAVMRAAGLSATADLSRIELRRGAQRLRSASEMRIAIAEGYTLDDLHLRAGDELVVGERPRRSLQMVLQAASVVTGLAALAFSLTR